MIIGKEKVTSRLISLFVIFVLQIFITQCYDYLKRKNYEQTDQSVRNFFSWNNYNTVL